MEIMSNLSIVLRNNKNLEVVFDGNAKTFEPTDTTYGEVSNLYASLRSTAPEERQKVFDWHLENGRLTDGYWKHEMTDENGNVVSTMTAEDMLLRGIGKLMSFFTEFEFEPNFRFTNTLAFKLAESESSAKDYVVNYFSLTDSPYVNEIRAKVSSKEFGLILKDIKNSGKPSHAVNNRFKVYYGSAGTGKTTLAQKESDNRCIVCNASMLPSDLMEDFIFENGQPSFKPSKLWDCMTNGLPITLDEINLLPFDSLRFLQGVLDGKKEFDYKGNKVIIADGFQVIGTMNLSIGGMVYGLPEPLVDRSSDFKKFSLSAEQLLESFK